MSGSVGKNLPEPNQPRRARKGKLQQFYDKSTLAQFQLKPAFGAVFCQLSGCRASNLGGLAGSRGAFFRDYYTTIRCVDSVASEP